MKIIFFFFICFYSFVFSSINTLEECTSISSSVVVPGDQSVTFAITPLNPILCWNLQISSQTDDNTLQYDFEILDDQYLLDNNADILLSINYNCTNTECNQSSTSTSTDVCIDSTQFINTGNTIIPIASTLINHSTNTLIIPDETITITYNFRWTTSTCDTGNNNLWIAYLVVGIIGALGTSVVLFIVVYIYIIKRKKTPPELDYSLS